MNEQRLSISFSGEASEAFSAWVSQRNDWYVRITPQEGEPFDAVLIGSGIENDQSEWYDSVRYLDADEDIGLPVEGATPKIVRVRDVYVY